MLARLIQGCLRHARLTHDSLFHQLTVPSRPRITSTRHAANRDETTVYKQSNEALHLHATANNCVAFVLASTQQPDREDDETHAYAFTVRVDQVQVHQALACRAMHAWNDPTHINGWS